MKKLLFVIFLCCWVCPVWAEADYAKIDQYAYEAPILTEANNLSQLVKYLVRPYKTDEEKARVILAWIVHNIDYDGYKANAINDDLNKTKKRNKELVIPLNNILETRIGVCGDIADLYKKMGELAGLTVTVIFGKARNEQTTLADFELGPDHAWNAVKIDDEWEFVDPTWAIGGEQPNILSDVEKNKDYKKIVKQRKKRHSDSKLPREGRVVNNEWFLTDKEEMIKTHFPFEEKWQLQKKKISKKEFLNLTDRKAYRVAKKELKQRKRGSVR